MMTLQDYQQKAEKHLKVIKQLTEELNHAYHSIYSQNNNEWELVDKANNEPRMKKLIAGANKYLKENGV